MSRPITNLVVGFLLAGSSPAFAGEKYAVIIGINQSGDKSIKPRPRAEADAKALYDLLISRDYGGMDPKHVRLLLGSVDARRGGQGATRQSVGSALSWLAASGKPGDCLILIFIGQGTFLDELHYLATDSVPFPPRNTITLSEITETLATCRQSYLCAFVDADLDLSASGRSVTKPGDLGDLYTGLAGLDDGAFSRMRPRMVILPSRAVTPSLDNGDHGLFAQVLLDGLRGCADKEGEEPDGLVIARELARYTETELPGLSGKYYKTKEASLQRPCVIGDGSFGVVLTTNPRAKERLRQRLQRLTDLRDKNELSPQFAAEGQALIARMPKSKLRRQLRASYNRVADGTLSVAGFVRERNTGLRPQVDQSAARSFATKVIDASRLVERYYFKPASRRELITSAIEGLYDALEEEVPADVQDRLRSKDLSSAALSPLLVEIRERLGPCEELTHDRDVEYALRGMMGVLDSSSSYLDSATMSEVTRQMTRNYASIGIRIRKDAATDALRVFTPVRDGPAYDAGIEPGDLIKEFSFDIDSEGKSLGKLRTVSTKGLAIGEAVKLITGRPQGERIKLHANCCGDLDLVKCTDLRFFRISPALRRNAWLRLLTWVRSRSTLPS